MADMLPTLYAVKVTVQAAALDDVVMWLEKKHIREVVAQPGFLSAELVSLDGNGAGGEQSLLVIYRLQSREALDAYFASPARERFSQEQAQFAHVMRGERWIGQVRCTF